MLLLRTFALAGFGCSARLVSEPEPSSVTITPGLIGSRYWDSGTGGRGRTANRSSCRPISRLISQSSNLKEIEMELFRNYMTGRRLSRYVCACLRWRKRRSRALGRPVMTSNELAGVQTPFLSEKFTHGDSVGVFELSWSTVRNMLSLSNDVRG